MKILEGKTLSATILDEVKKRAERAKELLSRPPSLRVINYYDDSPSSVYMNLKLKKASQVGIDACAIKPEISKGKRHFLSILDEMARDEKIDAIMVERPLPEGFDDWEFWKNMPPEKDPDCLSSDNNAKLYLSKDFSSISSGNFFVPCTALAAIKLLEHHGYEFSGKKCAVVGRSAVVGRPLAHMLSALNATVTLCHSKTTDLTFHLKNADYIFLAIGKAKWLKEDMIGEGQVIVDIGTNFDEKGSMCGDADFESVSKKVSAISPVPGGVGPVTLAFLLESSLRASEWKVKK